MPRINVEDKWYDDPRRIKLIEKIGQIATDGTALQLWRVAQNYYREETLIPKDIFKALEHANNFLLVGLCEERDDGVYVKGSKDCFNWIGLRRESGRKGAETTNKQQQQEPANSDKSQQTPASRSSSSSYSSSYSSKEDSESNKPPEAPPAVVIHLPLPDILTLWNSNCGGLAQAQRLTKKRLIAWRGRWSDVPDEGHWVSVIKRMAATPFCKGENDRGWTADLDFMLKPDTHVRVLEGKYDSKAGSRRKTFAEQREQMHRDLWERNERGELDEGA